MFSYQQRKKAAMWQRGGKVKWNYIGVFALLISCFATSGYAMGVTLQWVPNKESNLAGYRVYCRLEGQPYQYSHPNWEMIESTCTIYDLDETKTYYFVVRTFDTEGFESNNSNEVFLRETRYPVISRNILTSKNKIVQ